MDDFTAKPGVPNMYGLVQGEANAIAPGKRPLSSMSPTIVTKDGKPVMVVGTPGGSRIITAVLQTILNVIDYGMNVQEAVDAPRFHQQWLPERDQRRDVRAQPRHAQDPRGHGPQVRAPQPANHVAAILVGAPSLGGKPVGKQPLLRRQRSAPQHRAGRRVLSHPPLRLRQGFAGAAVQAEALV